MSSAKEQLRKSYNAPRLTRFGAVKDLTRGTGGTSEDGTGEFTQLGQGNDDRGIGN